MNQLIFYNNIFCKDSLSNCVGRFDSCFNFVDKIYLLQIFWNKRFIKITNYNSFKSTALVSKSPKTVTFPEFTSSKVNFN